MPWPDFSELTFGYSFLSEFERLHCGYGAFPQPPNFISQQAEADEGYDLEAHLGNGRLVLIQLKRSFVLTQLRDFPWIMMAPSYRMHLRKHRDYDQHAKLRQKQSDGFDVLYVTSRCRSRRDLVDSYAAGTLVNNATAAFEPLDIPQPRDRQQHWVSFAQYGHDAWMFSNNPKRLEQGRVDLFGRLQSMQSEPRGLEDNLRLLRGLLDGLIGMKRKDMIGDGSPSRLFHLAAFEVMRRMDSRLLIVPASDSAI